MRILHFIYLAVFILLVAPDAKAELYGRASIIDGDTIELQGVRIRMHGIDAPENGQLCKRQDQNYRCGKEAAMALADLIGEQNVRCMKKDTDRYQRIVAECFVGATNLNQSMVRNGWALAYRQYSNKYVPDEVSASKARNGMWMGSFVEPWVYRKHGAKSQPTEAPLNAACAIKGNISKEGRKIYHLPNAEHYSKTRISTKYGERWFCSEQEAVEAGWKKSKI